MITVAWIFALAMAFIPLLGNVEITFYSGFLGCVTNLRQRSSYAIVILVSFILLAIPLVVFNVWISCIVRRHIKAIYQVRKSLSSQPTPTEDELIRSMKKTRQQKELHLIHVSGGLLCSYAITWLPAVIVGFLLFLRVTIPAAVASTAQVFYVLQVVVHPILQTVLIREVRLPVRRLWCCCCVLVRARLTAESHSPHSVEEHICGCVSCSDQDKPHSDNGCGSGCGFFEVCNAAMVLQYSKSSSHDRRDTTITTFTDAA